ncbi:MAG: ribonuclease P protein component [Acidobacteria bacterium]|nr:ribonuclease P protein component [Acidobacteriota bacterium]
MDRRLSRRDRIRRRGEFLSVQRQGVRIHGRHLVLFTLPNGLDRSRLGIIATRRIGGAVRRNRAKRLMRELFRRRRGLPGFDVVALLRPGFPDVRFAALDADYHATLRRHGRTREGRATDRGPRTVPGGAAAAGRH